MKESKIRSKIKNKWIDVPNKDINFWLGQYLMAAMVIHAWSDKDGCPDRVGKIKDMKHDKRGHYLPFEAQWD